MFTTKLCESKEDTLGKIFKIYVAQTLLNKGVSSIQEQGLNLLTEFLIKLIRNVGSNAQKIYELQGRQEANIFHVLLALDHSRIKPNEILQHMKEEKINNSADNLQLNRMLQSLMEQIFKDKHGQPEEEYANNIRPNKNNTQKIEHLISNNIINNKPNKRIEEFLVAPIYFKDDIAPKEKKEITEKDLKETKKGFILKNETDNFNKLKDLIGSSSQKRKAEDGIILDDTKQNPFNVPLKKIKTIDTLNGLLQ